MTEQLTSATLAELICLTRRFGTLLNVGVPLRQALLTVADDASPAFQGMLRRAEAHVAQQGTLAGALEPFPDIVPAIYREWVRLGEDTGTLDVGALEIAELLSPVAAGGGDLALGWEHIESAISLIQFTRRFAGLLEKGLEWWRILVLLDYESPPRFARIIRELLPKRDDPRAWYGLWQIMEQYPETFSPFYRAAVRLGWEARTMDETMRDLAELLIEDWKLARRCRCYRDRASLIIDHGAAPLATWAELTPAQQSLTTILFCRAGSQLLAAGHARTDVITVAALLLPLDKREILLAGFTEDSDLAQRLRDLACFPATVTTLIIAGQRSGRIEYALSRAADMLHVI